MLIRQSLKLDRDDEAQVGKLESAFHLVGGKSSRQMVRGRNNELVESPEFKCFNRIFANDFAFEDVQEAVRFIRRRRKELIDNMVPVGINERAQQDWKQGVIANSNQAVRLAEEFAAAVRGDISLTTAA